MFDACCSGSPSLPSSPTTPKPTRPPCGRRQAPPRHSSPRSGAYGYATRRDLSSWGRTLFWALLALIVFGLVGIFVSIPGGNVIYVVAGLVIFGAFTIYDFNRLRHGADAAVVIAAAIFLDVFNVFLLGLQLFGGERK